jgi:hypothetical protein
MHAELWLWYDFLTDYTQFFSGFPVDNAAAAVAV